MSPSGELTINREIIGGVENPINFPPIQGAGVPVVPATTPPTFTQALNPTLFNAPAAPVPPLAPTTNPAREALTAINVARQTAAPLSSRPVTVPTGTNLPSPPMPVPPPVPAPGAAPPGP